MRGRRQILELFRRWDGLGEKIALAELMDGLQALALEAGDLSGVVGFDPGCYRRTIIHSVDHYQALVLCWRSGQGSPIHNHRGSNCAVRVVAGRATETRFVTAPCGRLLPIESHVHVQSSVTGCCGEDIHQVANLEPVGTELVTLHVYSPPPSGWRSFPVCDTTLADGDRLIQEPARTVRMELAHKSPLRRMSPQTKTRSGKSWRP